MARTTIFTLIILALIIFCSYLYLSSIQSKNVQKNLEASDAGSVLHKDQVYYNINNEPVELSNYLGQTIVAIAWASWCSNCHEQLRLINDVVKERDTVKALGFNRGEPQTTINDYLKFHNLDLEIEFVVDTDDHFFQSIDGKNMPEVVIFDAEGNIYHHERTSISAEELSTVLASME